MKDLTELEALIQNHPLGLVMIEALLDVVEGKGERVHGHGDPWESQPINLITRLTGPEGPLFQALKKAHEAVTNHAAGIKNPDEAYVEILGALVYLAHIGLLFKKQGLMARARAAEAGKEFDGYFFAEETQQWGVRTKDKEVGDDNQDKQPDAGVVEGQD